MEKSTKNDNAILCDIENGAYRNHYLTYNRKSTDEPENQKNSIQYQRAEIARYIDRERLLLAPVTLHGFSRSGVVSESHSAFKQGEQFEILDNGEVKYQVERPKFHKAMQFLSKGYFKGIICLCPDRLSRNEGDDTIINKLVRRGVDICYVYTKYEDTSAGELHRDIDQTFSRHHSRVTREKVMAVMRESRAAGKSTHRAPIGYLNEGNMDWKPQDPLRAPVIRDMFKFYASGEWSLDGLVRYAREQGCTSVPRRRPRTRDEMLEDEEGDARKELPKLSRPLTKTRVSEILRNPFYIGRIGDIDGTYRQSTSHEALVSDELFQQVQKKLRANTVGIHYTKKLDYPMRGLLRCAECKRVYTPYQQKGILYFGARCPAGCGNTKRNTNLSFVEEACGSILYTLPFNDDELAQIHEHTHTDIVDLDRQRAEEEVRVARKIASLRSDLAYLEENRLALLKSGAYSPEELVSEQERLNGEIARATENEVVGNSTVREIVDDLVKLSELVKNVTGLYEIVKARTKEKIARTIFSELFVAEDTLDYSVNTGFEPLKTRSVLLGAPNRTFSELCRDRHHIQESIEALKTICDQQPKM